MRTENDKYIVIAHLKRFMIRPIGVVSKKDIGARKMDRTDCPCRDLAAATPAIEKQKETMKLQMACAMPKAAYTPIYDCKQLGTFLLQLPRDHSQYLQSNRCDNPWEGANPHPVEHHMRTSTKAIDSF